MTGRAIIQAILRGTRAPEKLAKHRDKGCKASEAEIAQALTGAYQEEHLFGRKPASGARPFTLGPVEAADGPVAPQLGRLTGDRALPPLKPKPRPKRRANAPRFDVRTALYDVAGRGRTEVEGVSELTARTVTSATGPGVSRFATVPRLRSWPGPCPDRQKTGGRVESSRTRRGVRRAAQAPRRAARSPRHSRGAPGGRRRRRPGRPGARAAATATAHKLARTVYLALKQGTTSVRRTQEEDGAQMREEQVKGVRRRARRPGPAGPERAPAAARPAAEVPARG